MKSNIYCLITYKTIKEKAESVDVKKSVWTGKSRKEQVKAAKLTDKEVED